MSKQFYSLHVKKVEIEKDEWEKVRRRPIERIPIHGKSPDLYVQLKAGKKLKKTKVARNSFSPEWDEPINFELNEETKDIEIEVIHKTSLRPFNNPRVGHLSVPICDLVEERFSELCSPQSERVVGKIYLCLRRLREEDVVSETIEAINNFENHQETGLYNTIKSFVEFTEPMLHTLDEFSEIHPFLSSGWMIMSFLLKRIDVQFKTDEEIIGLVKEMSQTFKIIIEMRNICDKNDTLTECSKALSCQINECCLFIREYIGYGFLHRAISSQDQAKVKEFENMFRKVRENFELGVTVHAAACVSRVEFITSQIQKDMAWLNVHAALQPDTGIENIHLPCLPGTRLEYIQKITNELLLDTSDHNIVWLNGPAGVGKSTIALTIAEHCAQLSRLGAYVFFSRNKSQPGKVIQTIVDKLALFDASIAELVKKAKLESVSLSLRYQFEHLLLAPLQDAAERFHGPVVIVLDALDECGDVASREELMELFSSGEFARLPRNVRILITSRPEKDIAQSLEHRKGTITTIHLNPTDSSSRRDVSLYLNDKLTKIVKGDKSEDGEDIPLSEDVDILATAANGLFIWAATLVKLLKTDPRPTYRLKEIIEHIRFSCNLGFGLDDMYKTVLKNSRIFESYKDLACRLFSVILLSRRAISGDGIRKLLGLRADEVGLLSGLRSVLNYWKDEPIHFLHSSFSDYLTNKERSGEYYVDTSAYKALISGRCFSVMLGEGGLAVNICKLQSSLVKHEDVSNLREYISVELECACTLWSCMCDLGPVSTLVHALKGFLDGYLLQWFEVLSLTKSFHHAAPMLLSAIEWAKDHAKDYVTTLKEARRIANKYYIPISQSAPHAYLSTIPFEKELATRYSKFITPIVKVEEHGIKPLNALLNTIREHNDRVIGAIYSLDGHHMITSDTRSIKIWAAHSLSFSLPVVQAEAGFNIYEVVLSSNGEKLAAVLRKEGHKSRKFICIWSTETWKILVNPFPTRGHGICALKFTNMKDGEFLASCSEGGSISFWDPEDGSLKRSLEVKANSSPSDIIISASFSPTHPRIAYCYRPEHVLIWDWEEDTIVTTKKGSTHMHNYKFKDLMEFSPDGKILFSYSFGVLMMWEAETGRFIRSITTDISSFAISNDGKYIVTASGDITIWNIQNGESVLGPLGINDTDVTSAVFSHDGSRIVTGRGDGTIEIWDAELRNGPSVKAPPVDSPADSPKQVAYTKDGGVILLWEDGHVKMWDKCYKPVRNYELDAYSHTCLIASGRRIVSTDFKESIKVWDSDQGELIDHIKLSYLKSFEFSYSGRTIAILTKENDIGIWEQAGNERFQNRSNISVAFQSGYPTDISALTLDGSRFALRFDSQVIVIADATKGEKLCELPQPLNFLTFSPCGSYIAGGSFDTSKVMVYDAKDGHLVHELKGHTDYVTSVAYSPDGLYLASGSIDRTVIVWSMERGRIAFGPFTGHSQHLISLSFFSDSSRLASASLGGNIRVWSLKKTLISKNIGYEEGHSSNLGVWARNFSSKVDKHSSWTVEEDGWIRDDKGQLLLWVPADAVTALWRPQNLAIFNSDYFLKLTFRSDA